MLTLLNTSAVTSASHQFIKFIHKVPVPTILLTYSSYLQNRLILALFYVNILKNCTKFNPKELEHVVLLPNSFVYGLIKTRSLLFFSRTTVLVYKSNIGKPGYRGYRKPTHLAN